MSSSRVQILKRLKELNPELLADALEELGVFNKIINASVSGIKAVNYDQPLCGLAYTILFCDKNDPRPAIGTHTRDYLNHVPPGVVVVIHNEAGTAFSTWGALLSHYADKHGMLGTVTDGSIRDVDEIKRGAYPVYAVNSTCSRGTGHYKVVEVQTTITISGVNIHPDDYIIASNSGLVVLEPEYAEKTIELAEKNKQKEAKIVSLIAEGFTLFEIDEMNQSRVEPKMIALKK